MSNLMRHPDRRIVRVDRHVHARPRGGPRRERRARSRSGPTRPRSSLGAGYRYPQAGWIVLHIEGEPYERGYQHGRLMAPEIARFVEALAAYRSPKAPGDAWRRLGCWPTPCSCGSSTPSTSRR